MHRNFEYTTQARKIALRFPVLNHILIQINFWIISFLLLYYIIHITILSMIDSYAINISSSYWPGVIISITIGILFGTIIGFLDLTLEKNYFRKWSLGAIIFTKAFLYGLILLALLHFTRYVLWQQLLVPHFFEGNFPITTRLTWKYYTYILLIYSSVAAGIISFINLMNKKFGPGVLIPMLLGKYRNPLEEEGILSIMEIP